MKYNRILLKLSGESLQGAQKYGLDPAQLQSYAEQIKAAMETFSKSTMDVFAKVYQQGNPGAGDPGAGTGYTYQGGQGSNVNDDGTVDSEFTDNNN